MRLIKYKSLYVEIPSNVPIFKSISLLITSLCDLMFFWYVTFYECGFNELGF